MIIAGRGLIDIDLPALAAAMPAFTGFARKVIIKIGNYLHLVSNPVCSILFQNETVLWNRSFFDAIIVYLCDIAVKRLNIRPFADDKKPPRKARW